MRLIAIVLTLGIVLIAPAAGAQPAYPTRPVDIVVAFAPGGGADVAARLIAAYASKKWGQSVNVVNMPGASGITGALHVLRARPDGHTLLLEPHATSSMLFAVQSDVPFKMEDKTPIALITVDPVIYTVKADSPWKTLADVAAAAKANPKGFRYGLAGVSGVATFSISQFLYAAGVP
ncbi:MAG: tripartite tricarboxylate transporter substrate binding protein, partial [Candidatus Rokubacteria bacterium]|nr:tripartite tricarboxylate transporter substrate binding protein [Candidatus Rokubacteria bacterium]